MSKSNDKTDKRLLNQYLVRQAHIKGIAMSYNEKEAQDQLTDDETH